MANVTHIEYEIYVYNSFVSAVTGDTWQKTFRHETWM